MATSQRIITLLSQADGSPPTPPQFETAGVIAKRLNVVQDKVSIIGNLFEQKDVQIRLIRRNKDYTPTALGEQIRTISAKFDAQIAAAVKIVNDNCNVAQAIGAMFFTHEACRMRAVNDASSALIESTLALVRRCSAAQLTDLAALAAARGDQVLAGCIAIEVAARTEGPGDGPGSAPRLARGQIADINALLDTVPTDAEKVQPMLLEFEILRREAEIRSGAGTPTAKIALALLKQGAS